MSPPRHQQPDAGSAAHSRTQAAGRATQPRRRRPRLPAPLLLTAITVAWAVGITAQVTGRADLVHHHELVDGGLALADLALFLLAWQLHVVAMMLPSSLPLVHLFNRASAHQPRPRAARTAFVTGYLAVWSAFGVVLLLGDAIAHDLVHRWAWLDARPHLIAGTVLLLAGAFQFSALKDACLQECRHPAVFLQQHYRRGVRQAFSLGRRHGLYCLGCCWALMLVMFSVGIANLAWMAPFALLMLYEKAGRGGDRSTKPVGVGLLALGTLVLLNPQWLPALLPQH